MVPSDTEKKTDNSQSITREDILSVIELAKKNLITDSGELIADGKPITDIYECLKQKSSHHHYKQYLEIKASTSKQVKKKTVKPVEKPAKTNKKRKSGWDWEDD